MMTIPKWLLPALAIVAAVAVAAAAALLGARFAPVETRPVDAPTVSAPVLAPIDPATSLADELRDDGTVSGSPVTGEREVTESGAVPEGTVPSDIAEALDALAASDDPGADPDALAAASDDPAVSGDPCAPADDSDPPADCPEGLRSTILRSIALPPLYVNVGNPRSEDCRIQYANNAVTFDVVVNAPADTVITWQQDGGEVHTQSVSTDPDDNDAWQAALADADEIGPWIWLHTCVRLDNLTPFLGVRITLDSVDFQGRRATDTRTLFPLEDRGRPPTDIIPVGNSTVFVSAPLKESDEVRIRAFPVPEGATPDCDASPSETGHLDVVQPVETHTVSAESLAAGGYLPEFTQRTSTAFAVPAASRVMVCVRWYDSHRNVVWDSDTPYFRSEVVLASPDLDVPSISLDAIQLGAPVAPGSITLDGSTEDGIACGSWTGPDTGTTSPLAAPVGFCDYSALLGRSNANGALTITTRVQTPGGLAVMPHLLPIALEPCDGCSGRTQTFDVPLSTFVRPSGLCSGDCPTNTGQAAGVARFTATWHPRVGSGSSGWYFGERVEGDYTIPRPDFPQMNVGETVQLGAVDAANRSQTVSFRLQTDRAVTYSVELGDDACIRPGGSRTVSDDTTGVFHVVTLTGLCLGTGYAPRVTLTDDAGQTATYTVGVSEHFWPAGQFWTTEAEQPAVVSLDLSKPGAGLTYLYDLRVNFGYGPNGLLLDPGRRCFDGAITPADYSQRLRVGETIPIEVYAGYTEGAEPSEDYRHADGSEPCIPADGSTQRFLHLRGSVTLEQVLAGATVTMTDPDSGYTAVVHLRRG